MPKSTDAERAAAVLAFYGLGGSQAILAPGYLPSQHAPQGATEFEQSMRIRLDKLARDNSGYSAGPEEAAALRAAGLHLKERGNGKWGIDRTKVGSEAEVKADAIDQQNAANVLAFYGLGGSQAILAPGYLPSQSAPQGATEFEQSMRRRLDSLARENSKYRAGPEEAAALRAAGLHLKEREKGGWAIDRTKVGSEAEVKADAIDQQNAANVLAFYGLDGSQAILAPGYLPSRYAPEGATEFEQSMRIRLDRLARDNSGCSAGPLEAAALQRAQFPLKGRGNGRWGINKSAVTAQVVDYA
ncbi:hypothetical protein AB0N07_07245 [Streptomyces sp. NPDC051172]|uniref:hypothetical protein n=1 Tax=Streptomyces sp. NPDC051172 TaxID=3155796 RepID=UPI00343A334C